MTRRRFEASLDINAPSDRVWRALTDAPTLIQWFATDAEIDLRPGGRAMAQAVLMSWMGGGPDPRSFERAAQARLDRLAAVAAG